MFVYDSGIFEWANAQPERSEFWGERLSAKTIDKKLISPEELSAAFMEAPDYVALAQSGDWKIFDVRDRKEREDTPVKIKGVVKCTVDQFAAFLGKPGIIPASNILVMDNVGKQVKWIQYYLKKHGRTDYHFLKGGVAEWYKQGFDEKGNK